MGLDPTRNPDCTGFVTRQFETVNRNRRVQSASRQSWTAFERLGSGRAGAGWTLGAQTVRGTVQVQMVSMGGIVIGCKDGREQTAAPVAYRTKKVRSGTASRPLTPPVRSH